MSRETVLEEAFELPLSLEFNKKLSARSFKRYRVHCLVLPPHRLVSERSFQAATQAVLALITVFSRIVFEQCFDLSLNLGLNQKLSARPFHRY
eukprot:6192896-Pleurochrysis_carterae.AAC.1